MFSRQRGFTLIEISIVLVIIGLLLGGVLKGQEMINEAKIRNIEKDMDGIAAAVYTYQDRYKALPGDDPGATRWKAKGGNGDGKITGGSSDDESLAFWNHLRYAGLLHGDPESTSAPQHGAGGVFSIQGESGSLLLCAQGLPRKFTEIIDTHQDDGKLDKGRLRIFKAGETVVFSTPLTAYDADDSTTYTLCKIL